MSGWWCAGIGGREKHPSFVQDLVGVLWTRGKESRLGCDGSCAIGRSQPGAGADRPDVCCLSIGYGSWWEGYVDGFGNHGQGSRVGGREALPGACCYGLPHQCAHHVR